MLLDWDTCCSETEKFYQFDEINRSTSPISKFCQFVNPYPAKLFYLNFQRLEVVSRYRDPQPQVVENYSYLFNLRANIKKCRRLNSHSITSNSDLLAK